MKQDEIQVGLKQECSVSDSHSVNNWLTCVCQHIQVTTYGLGVRTWDPVIALPYITLTYSLFIHEIASQKMYSKAPTCYWSWRLSGIQYAGSLTNCFHESAAALRMITMIPCTHYCIRHQIYLQSKIGWWLTSISCWFLIKCYQTSTNKIRYILYILLTIGFKSYNTNGGQVWHSQLGKIHSHDTQAIIIVLCFL